MIPDWQTLLRSLRDQSRAKDFFLLATPTDVSGVLPSLGDETQALLKCR